MKKNFLTLCIIVCIVFFISVIVLFKYIRLDGAGNKNEVSNKEVENNTKNEEQPLLIKTSSGAVLVGTIKKDENDFYFVPEQPLNITLTYFIDHPEEFENIRRIDIISSDEDGINESIYENTLVTISGAITNPRSQGKLYLIPYKIEIGKTVDKSYANENLKYLETNKVEFDLSKLSSKMKPKIEANHFVYNPYILSEETLEYMGNDFADFYINFVDAFFNYNTVVVCENKNFADLISTVIFYEFPLFTADAKIGNYDENNKILNIKYSSKNKEEHEKLINDFYIKINYYLINIKEDDSEQIKAQKIYHSFSKEMIYDYDVLDTRVNVEPYYAFTNKKGVCVTFALAYSILLNQVGIKNTIVSASTSDSEGHIWNAITIDYKNYFADVTYELGYENGNYYKYFGNGMTERIEMGFKEEEIFIGKYNVKSISEYKLEENNLQVKYLNY